ncbi:MAG: hypothetical protein DDT34_01131 [Firmicutes bacterium]|nr:hypothetical protein [Bacillota bacterium]MBT9157291.1 hypothetical protein [Bacillota bacterium]
MKKISVYDAIGSILCHDITRIVPGEFKGAAFKKGHVVTASDIPLLLELGKEHLYVWEDLHGQLHENQAALRIATACAGAHISLSAPSEGKINLVAERRALVKVAEEVLLGINSVPEIIVATRHNNQVVEAGAVVAGTRVIPLVIPEARVVEVEKICAERGPVVWAKPLLPKTMALVTTGNEIYYGRIADKFGPVIAAKAAAFDCFLLPQVLAPDDAEVISQEIILLAQSGAEIIAVSGGMSVDPDDVTPRGIALAGGILVSYGVPVLPGSMFMLAYLGEIPIIGLPGCVMYCQTTILDLILPRLLAGERLTQRDLAALGHGGLCLGCAVCHYPVCPFGK